MVFTSISLLPGTTILVVSWYRYQYENSLRVRSAGSCNYWYPVLYDDTVGVLRVESGSRFQIDSNFESIIERWDSMTDAVGADQS